MGLVILLLVYLFCYLSAGHRAPIPKFSPLRWESMVDAFSLLRTGVPQKCSYPHISQSVTVKDLTRYSHPSSKSEGTRVVMVPEP